MDATLIVIDSDAELARAHIDRGAPLYDFARHRHLLARKHRIKPPRAGRGTCCQSVVASLELIERNCHVISGIRKPSQKPTRVA
jgi:hypothetical protein